MIRPAAALSWRSIQRCAVRALSSAHRPLPHSRSAVTHTFSPILSRSSSSTAGVWTLSCAVDGLPIRINGNDGTAADANRLAGGSFVMEVGPNLVEFKDMGAEGVEVVLNQSQSYFATGELQLHFSKHAACVGDACIMWPPLSDWGSKISSVAQPEATSTADWGIEGSTSESNDEFMSRIAAELPPEDFLKLQLLLGQGQSAVQDSSTHATADLLVRPHHSPKVTEIQTEQQLEYLIQAAGNRTVVVDFWADWCIPCINFAPAFAEYALQNDDMIFAKLNIQQTAALKRYATETFGVTTLPSLLFIKDGRVLSRLDKADEAEFEQLMSQSRVALSTASEPLAAQEVRPTKYDLVVIGGGSGGLAAAKEAAKHGARVCLFDYVKPSEAGTRWGFGGTCVNVGCIPKKLMHYAALCGEAVNDAKSLGWTLGATPHNGLKHEWSQMVRLVQNHIKKLNFFYENGVQAPSADQHAGVWYYNALAKFEGTHEASWADDFGNTGMVESEQFIVAVGGRPIIPPELPGKELAITSDDLFSLADDPGKVLCVGAGYISLECGGFLNSLGHETHVAVRSVPLRTGFDRDAADMVVDLMQLQGTKFLRGCSVAALRKSADGRIEAEFVSQDGLTTTDVYDTVLYATGRRADTTGLNLEVAQVSTDGGKIIVDEAERSSAPNIHSIGDCATGPATIPELTPVAIQSGEMLARRLFDGSEKLMDYSCIPTTVFTPSEMGSIGLPEHEAIDKYGAENVEIYIKVFENLEISSIHRQTAQPYREKDWDPLGKMHLLSDRESSELPPTAMAKLICLKSEQERIVGFHYVGPQAGEVTQGFAVAIKMGARKEDFDATVGIHPTDAESFTMLDTTKSSGEDWIAYGGCGGGKCG